MLAVGFNLHEKRRSGIFGVLLAILSIFTSEVRCFLGLVSESCPKTFFITNVVL
jgi:hypothetical protein